MQKKKVEIKNEKVQANDLRIAFGKSHKYGQNYSSDNHRYICIK